MVRALHRQPKMTGGRKDGGVPGARSFVLRSSRIIAATESSRLACVQVWLSTSRWPYVSGGTSGLGGVGFVHDDKTGVVGMMLPTCARMGLAQLPAV
jgi:hypothetical protein